MAKALVIYGHPAAPYNFNLDLKERLVKSLAARGHAVSARDLYAAGFDPVLSEDDLAATHNRSVPLAIKFEQSLIRDAEAVIFIYPIWWSGAPAIIKGYFDRVMTNGFAYTFRNGIKVGLLSGRRALVINSHGNPAAAYDEGGYYDATRLLVDDGILRYCGFDAVRHIFYGDMSTKSPEEKEADIASATEAALEFIESGGTSDSF
jgi:NAD(P)H dehydrogenase (quinone)